MYRILLAAALIAVALLTLPRATAQETPKSAQCIHIAAHGEPAAAAARIFMDRQIAEERVRFVSIPGGSDATGRPLAGVLCAW